jgi:hypothetical protein
MELKEIETRCDLCRHRAVKIEHSNGLWMSLGPERIEKPGCWKFKDGYGAAYYASNIRSQYGECEHFEPKKED